MPRKREIACALLAGALLVSAAVPVCAVIIDSADGSGNTDAPPDDPGWVHVGTIGSLSAIYLGEGWVLTANHVGVGPVTFDGVTYDPVPGSEVRLETDEYTSSDLLLFAIDPHPELPKLRIRPAFPHVGLSLVMIGHGRNRGDPTQWYPNGVPPPGPFEGYEWGVGRSMRWGENDVDGHPDFLPFGTVAFFTFFDEETSPHEGHAANGDSGGAVFVHNGLYWELGGVMYAVGVFAGQPGRTALYGNRTYVADLSYYRDRIVQVTGLPEPDGSLLVGAGAAFVAAIGRRRSRRRAGR